MRDVELENQELFKRRIPLPQVVRRVSELTGVALRDLQCDALLDAIGAPVHLIPDWRARTPEELIVQTQLLELWPATSTTVVVPEVSYDSPPAGFVVPSDDLRAFVLGPGREMGEAFFTGDVVVVGWDTEAIWSFHHEGAWAHRRFAPVDGGMQS